MDYSIPMNQRGVLALVSVFFFSLFAISTALARELNFSATSRLNGPGQTIKVSLFQATEAGWGQKLEQMSGASYLNAVPVKIKYNSFVIISDGDIAILRSSGVNFVTSEAHYLEFSLIKGGASSPIMDLELSPNNQDDYSATLSRIGSSETRIEKFALNRTTRSVAKKIALKITY